MKRIATALAFILTVSLFIAEQASQASGRRNDPAAVKKAIEKSLPLLESIRLPFIEKTGCVSCHHNSLPAMAAALARERGFKLSERTSLEESEQILGIWNTGREKLLQGDGFGGAQVAASYTLVGLAANKQPPNKTTDAVVHYLIGRQLADGRWSGLLNRPPLGGSDIAVTALSLRALQLYAPKGLRQEAHNRVERAREWLAKASPINNEGRSFQLLGLAWANADKQTLQKMAQALLAKQRKDGGWGQQLTMESDAYATGQALVALHQAGGLPVTHRAYQRGVNYLLANQAADGSWMVATRSFPFQKYFESGFPYGHNQWISAAASSWATMALILTVEAPVNPTATARGTDSKHISKNLRRLYRVSPRLPHVWAGSEPGLALRRADLRRDEELPAAVPPGLSRHDQKGKDMTERICKRCGGDLSEWARFCARCGEVASVVSSAGFYAPETRPLAREEAEQTVPPHAAPTEEMPAILMSRKESSER